MGRIKYWDGTAWKEQAPSAVEFDAHKVDYTLQIPYAVATGTANTYAISLPITALVAGMAVSVKINVASSGVSTLNWDGKGAIGLKKADGTDVTNLKLNGVYTFRYDGTNFIVQGEGGSGNATTSDLLSGKTATTDVGDIVGSMPNMIDGRPVSSDVGYYDGAGTIYARMPADTYLNGINNFLKITDPRLLSANIKAGVSIFGAVGSGTVVDTQDAVLDPSRLLVGYSGYDDGALKNGTMPARGSEEYAGWRRGEMGPNGAGAGRAHLRVPTGAYLEQGGSPQGAGYVGIFIDDPNFIAANIKNGVNIFGNVGNLSPRLVATGSGTSGGTAGYTNNAGGVNNFGQGIVSGLSFKPTFIMLRASTANAEKTYYSVAPNPNPAAQPIEAGSASGAMWIQVAGTAYVNASGFNLPIGPNGGIGFTWWAYA